MERPTVTVACAAYNHAAYIADAIDGLLIQKTEFPVEIIIYDDASTDGTADIIRAYAEKYPDRITAILQSENQWSKGKTLLDFLFSKANGEYIAICEGDDYWTDPLKLQKQVQAMKEHPELDVCASCTALESDGKIIGYCAPAKEDTVLSMDQVILGGGDFVSTCSLMIRTDAMMRTPDFTKIMYIDYVFQMNSALRGGMLYLSDCMSVYRTFTSNSWTVSYFSDSKMRQDFNDKMKRILNLLNEETEGKYSSTIGYKIKELDYFHLNNSGKFREMLSPEYREVVKRQTAKNRVKLYLRCVFPGLVKKRRERKLKKAKTAK